MHPPTNSLAMCSLLRLVRMGLGSYLHFPYRSKRADHNISPTLASEFPSVALEVKMSGAEEDCRHLIIPSATLVYRLATNFSARQPTGFPTDRDRRHYRRMSHSRTRTIPAGSVIITSYHLPRSKLPSQSYPLLCYHSNTILQKIVRNRNKQTSTQGI